MRYYKRKEGIKQVLHLCNYLPFLLRLDFDLLPLKAVRVPVFRTYIYLI